MITVMTYFPSLSSLHIEQPSLFASIALLLLQVSSADFSGHMGVGGEGFSCPANFAAVV